MKGRKPLPIELHVLNGNPSKLDLPEPVPVESGRPDYPDHLDEAGRLEWDHACEIIEGMGILSKSDRFAVEVLVDTYIRWRRACIALDKYGELHVIDADKRVFKRSPYWSIRNACWDQLYKMLGEFGLTPSARARLRMPGKAKETKRHLKYFA